MKLEDLTADEYDKVVIQVGDRVKNLTYMKGEDVARKTLDGIKDVELSSDTQIHLNYQIGLLHNDIIEMIGGLRRSKEA